MKKLAVSVLVGILMSFGLVAIGAPTASAAPCTYGGCQASKTRQDAPRTISTSERATVFVTVRPRDNSDSRFRAEGTLRLVVRSANGSRPPVVRTQQVDTSVPASRQRNRFTLPRLVVGNFTIQTTYTRGPNARYRSSTSAIRNLRVTPRR